MKPIQLFLLLLSLHSLPSAVHSDLASERAALVTLRDTVEVRSLLWNLSSNLCSWVGVFSDSTRTTVVELRLPGMGLSGQLFSGTIPDFLFNLQNLVRLNLAHNNFSGTISPGFNRLTRLQTLFLEENHLTGSIPDFTVQPQQFNVSFNNLTGLIPKSVSRSLPSSFLGKPSLCGKPLASCDGASSGGGGKKKLSGGAIAGIVIACIVGFLLILMILICLCQRKGRGR